MPKFEITFVRELTYTMVIAAKDEDEAHDKLFTKLETITPKALEKLIADYGDFEITETNGE